MMNRTEAIIVTAAIALATLPRFEAKVEQFTKEHRAEIQMAVNQLEGKPAIPFAAPEAAPKVELAFAAEQNQEQEVTDSVVALARSRESLRQRLIAAREQRGAEMSAAQVRAEVAALKVNIPVQVRMQLAELQPQLAGLRRIAERNPHNFKVYHFKAKRCLELPVPPAAPMVEMPSASTAY